MSVLVGKYSQVPEFAGQLCGAVLVVAVGHANQTTQPSADLSNHFTGNSDPCLCHPLHQCSHTLNLLPAEPC